MADESVGLMDRFVWAEGLWFPVTVKHDLLNKTFSWKDLENGPGSSNYYPQIRELNLGVILGIAFVVVRYFIESFIFAPIGHWLGIPRKKKIVVTPHPVLEKAYTQHQHVDDSTIKILSKQLDLPVRKIEIWLKNRKRKDGTALITKFCNNSLHLLFYTMAFTYGCVILWDKPWLWKTSECWTGWPAQHVPEDIYWYYVIELAFYVSLILTLFTDHKRKDFNEMIAHHIATVVLIYFSWVSNLVRIGSLVLLLHDVSDPWLALAKMGLYFKKKDLTNVCFVMFVLTWIVPRMFYFPCWILNSTLFEVQDVWNTLPFSYYFFNGFLFVLFVLHMIWTHRLVKMVIITVTGGEVADSRSDDEDEAIDDEINTPTNSKESTPVRNGYLPNGKTNGTNGNGSILTDRNGTNGSTLTERNGTKPSSEINGKEANGMNGAVEQNGTANGHACHA